MKVLFYDNEEYKPFKLSEVITIQIAYRKDKDTPFVERMNLETFGIQDSPIANENRLCWVVRYGNFDNVIALPINQFRIEAIIDETKTDEIEKGGYKTELSVLFHENL